MRSILLAAIALVMLAATVSAQTRANNAWARGTTLQISAGADLRLLVNLAPPRRIVPYVSGGGGLYRAAIFRCDPKPPSGSWSTTAARTGSPRSQSGLCTT